ncbi:non-specific serine/threonine protein kinase [Plasmodiophora brassicae]
MQVDATPVDVVPLAATTNVEEDDPAYAERVEAEMQAILAEQEKTVDAEDERRKRQERRRAMMQAVQGDAAPPPAVEPAAPIPPPAIEQQPNAPDDDAVQERPPGTASVDIFGDSPIADGKALSTGADVVGAPAADNLHLTDNWDDAEGYYSFRLGDRLQDGRYEVFANQGRGVFSTVLRVRDRLAGNRELVVKVIRLNDVMFKAGQKEINMLKILGANDPENRRHCVRLLNHFEHRGHLCLVFEPLSMNLREVLKKYGGVGINIDGVRSYARQLFTALRLLSKCKIIHADIKPDNILVNDAKNIVKLCDFGSAGTFTECDITPYLVSRFYRAPEIMLGLPYGAPIDVWSIGCVLFELFTGQILFKGADNNEMLLRIMELRGSFPVKLLRKAAFAEHHFDADFVFERRRVDKVTKAAFKVKMRIERPTRDLHTLLRQSAGRMTDADMKALSQLKDLVDKCLIVDPTKRITPEAARSHPFLQQAPQPQT